MTSIAEKLGLCKRGKSLTDRRSTVSEGLVILHRKECDRTLSVCIFPSGDFSVGVIPSKKMSKADEEYERTKGRITEHCLDWQEGEQKYYEHYTKCEKTGIPPNLVDPPKSSQRGRGRYGLNGITGYGKKMLRSSAVLMENEFGRENCGFATVTLPPLPLDEMRVVASNWSYIVRRFFQSLKRDYDRQFIDRFRFAYCTEIQENRSDGSGIPVLHIHFLYRCRKWRSGDWLLDAGRVRTLWRVAIQGYCPSLSEDMYPRVRLEVVRKSVAGYIGKYLSKGAASLQRWIDAGYADMLPSTWWGMSACLRKDIKHACLRSQGAFADFFWQLCRDNDRGVILWHRDVCIETEARGQIRVGYFGQCIYELCNDLLQTLDGK